MQQLDEIYSRLLFREYQSSLFEELEKFYASETRVEFFCPFHHHDRAEFVFFPDRPTWKCDCCKFQGDWVQYLIKKRNLSFQESLQLLARDAGIELEFNELLQPLWQRNIDSSNILEDIATYFQEQLWKYKGEKTLFYLQEHEKLTGFEIYAMELGFIPSKDQTLRYLSQYYTSEELEQSLYWHTDEIENYLTVPYRDSLGRLQSLWLVKTGPTTLSFDCVQPILKPYTCLVSNQSKPSNVFNFHRNRGFKHLILVEGLLDALSASYQGLKGVVATGGYPLSRKQIRTAMDYGAEKWIILLNNGAQKEHKIQQVVESLHNEGSQTEILELPSFYETPLEWIRYQGIDILKEQILNKRYHANWMAK